MAFCRWVCAVDDTGQLLLGVVACLLDGQDAILADDAAAGASFEITILNNECACAAGFDANAKSLEFAILQKAVADAGLC